MGDGNLDLVKILTLFGSLLGSAKAIYNGYRKVFRSSETVTEEPVAIEAKTVSAPARSLRPPVPEEDGEEAVSSAKLTEVEQQIHKLRAEQLAMHRENQQRNDEADRRQQTLAMRYSDIDRKIEELSARLTEVKDKKLEEMKEQLREIKHDLREDLRNSHQSLRDATDTINRLLSQIKLRP